MNKRKRGYRIGVEREMYLYFSSYSGAGAPSFSKFARFKGVTLKELCSYRRHKKFEEAFEECSALRRDFLIDRALMKNFDGSFVKYLIDGEKEDTPAEINFKLEVIQ